MFDLDAITAICMMAAKNLEGGRRVRTLDEADVQAFMAACQAHPAPIKTARAYAGAGSGSASFVPNSYRFRAPITIIEPGWFLPVVRVTDAKRNGGKGAAITINGRAAQ